MIKFLLLVNKQGQTRLSQYYEHWSIEERVVTEAEIIRKCLARSGNQCSIIEFRNFTVVYRRYASLFFIVGVDEKENTLCTLEWIHALVETFDQIFENVCELDLMFNLERVYMVIDEMIVNGCLCETNRSAIISTLEQFDKATKT